MKKFQMVSGAFLLSLTGCSSIGSGWNNTVDFIFGPDDGAGQRQETAAKMASDAAGSANPEQTLVDGVVKKSVDKAATSTVAAIDNSMAHSKTGPVIATGNLVYLRNALSDCFLQKTQA